MADQAQSVVVQAQSFLVVAEASGVFAAACPVFLPCLFVSLPAARVLPRRSLPDRQSTEKMRPPAAAATTPSSW